MNSVPPWLHAELTELRDNLQGTVGNDYARVVEDIMARLAQSTPEAGTSPSKDALARLDKIIELRQHGVFPNITTSFLVRLRSQIAAVKRGDWLVVNGRHAVAVHPPQVVVLYEDLDIAAVPLSAVERSGARPEIKAEDIERARDRWPEVKPS